MLICLLVGAHQAAVARCDLKTADAAMQEAEARPPTWAHLYRSFELYGNCRNDAEIGELYSDRVALLLADHWDTLHDLNVLVQKTPAFGDFVLFYVDELMSPEQAEQINANARDHCPRQEHAFCKRLIHRLREMPTADSDASSTQ